MTMQIKEKETATYSTMGKDKVTLQCKLVEKRRREERKREAT
jgi:hypothetical protein